MFVFGEILRSEVLKLLQTSDSGKAVGVDKISNRILKLSAPYIYTSLTAIFYLSFQTNTVPDDCKVAKVTPIFKTDDRCDTNNYLLISVISGIARVFERLVYNKLESYVTQHNLISP